MISKFIQFCLFFCTALWFCFYVIPTSMEREADRQDYVMADTYNKYGDYYE